MKKSRGAMRCTNEDKEATLMRENKAGKGNAKVKRKRERKQRQKEQWAKQREMNERVKSMRMTNEEEKKANVAENEKTLLKKETFHYSLLILRSNSSVRVHTQGTGVHVLRCFLLFSLE